MRNQLYQEIINALIPYRGSLPFEDIKAQITIILGEYDVTQRHTEVAILNEDKNARYLALFLASKAAGGRTDRTLKAYDIKAVHMAYVQLSLYDIPALVYQTDTLRDPNGDENKNGKLYTYGWLLAGEKSR